MTKQEYLAKLESMLKKYKVADTEEILAEYQEHFAYKEADGYGEEEIAAKLASPEEIAAQFAQVLEPKERKRGGNRILRGIGLVFADLFIIPFFLILFACVVVVGAAALAFFAAGIALMFNISLIIPYIPGLGRVLLGISLLALAGLSMIGALYSNQFAVQLVKACRRWHKKVMGHMLPPLPKHPQVAGKTRRRMRTTATVSLIVFAFTFIAALVILFIQAGDMAPWHAWQWFQ